MAKWTRELIIRQILHRESASLQLTPGGEAGVEPTLYQAGSRSFGSWRNALMAAGISPDRAHAHDRWPPARILAVIRTLSRRRRPRRPGELNCRHNSLMQAAHRVYGSWPKAVIAAGVDPLKFKSVAPWTRERIIEAILTRALKNEPLRSGTVRPKSLAEAAARVFGSWKNALAAAGLDPKHYVRHSSIAGLTAVAEMPAQFEPQILGSLRDTHDALPAASVKSFAPGRPAQRWSHEAVLQAILKRLREHRPMNAMSVCKEDRPLYSATKTRFGSWRGALLAAGLNPEEFRVHGGRGRGG